MKIEISIEKDGEDKGKKSSEGMDYEEELTPEQIAEMAKKLKSNKTLSRSERVLLSNYLMQEMED